MIANQVNIYQKIVVVLVAVVIIGFCLAVSVTSADSSGWLSATEQPTLLKDKDVDIDNEGFPPSLAGLGNIDCQPKTVTTRPKLLFPPQSEIVATDCFINTAIGPYSSNGLLKINNTKVAGKVTNYTNINQGTFSVPNSPNVIHTSSGTGNGGLALRLTKYALSKLSIEVLQTQEVKYKYIQPPDMALRDKAGNLLSARTNSLSFSKNGSWFVVDVPPKGMMRVNTDNFDQVVPFAQSFNYNIGLDPDVKTAVSNDGRFVAIASRNFTIFRLYDLSTCPPVPDSISSPLSCQYRDLWQYMGQQLPGFLGAFNIRFITNDVIEFYGFHNPGTGGQLAKYRLAAPGKNLVSIQYLALGDSYISGEGAFIYKDGTDVSPNKCHLSQISYPYLIKQELNLTTAESVACSGAVINDLITERDDYTGQVKDNVPKSERTNLLEIVSSYLPGYIAQNEFLDEYKPEVVTISAVGNDIGFGDKIKRCIGPDTCYSFYEDRIEVVQEINSKFDELTNLYTTIKNKSAANARVYAVGYPSIAKENGNCGVNVLLNNDEIIFSNQLISYLNLVIKNAAQNAGVHYVDIYDALDGHRLCEATYSNIAVNGVTRGDDSLVDGLGPFGKESYHPNQMGHRLLKTKVLEATSNFTVSMPAPNPASIAPTIDDSLPLLVNAPSNGRELYNTIYKQDLTNDVTVRGNLLDIVINDTLGLKPLFGVDAVLQSEPVQLGTFSTDSSGGLAAQIQIPESVTPGFHTLHLYGQNVLGEKVDIQKIIFVAADEHDYDGNGVPNTEEKCLGVEPANLDEDMDGIDDACDPQIDEPPLPPTVYITSPASGSVLSGTANIEAIAEDELGVSNIRVQIAEADLDHTLFASPYIYPWDTTTVTNGNYTVLVTATNEKGLSSSQSIVVQVQNNSVEESPKPLGQIIKKLIKKTVVAIKAIVQYFVNAVGLW